MTIVDKTASRRLRRTKPVMDHVITVQTTTGKAGKDEVVELTSPGKPTVRRDGDAVVIDIPLSFRRRSGRKEVVLPPDAVAAGAVSVKPPAPLAIALARAFHWQEMIENGQAHSNSDLARQLQLDQSYVARTIRLTSLAPEIIEAVLNGQAPDGLSLWTLRRDLPLLWNEQRKSLGMETNAHACTAVTSSITPTTTPAKRGLHATQ
jgi:hypothetical protein